MEKEKFIEIGKKTRFSSENQPSNNSKAVPKWRTQIKKKLKERSPQITDAIIKACEEGSIKHIEFVKNWIYGKDTEKIEHTVNDDTIKELKELFNKAKEERE